jgi:pimeloyl-ACP methyl ester carboxylesterase
MLEYPWQVDGTLTRVLEAGREGVPTVLLHGVGARADRWRENLEPLAEAGLHVFAIDLPGHGFAAKGDGFSDYSVSGYATLLERLLDSVGAERAVLIGTSLGGHIAAEFTCRSPDRVAALVMVGTLGLVPLGQDGCERLAASLADTSESGIRAKLGRVIHDPASVTDDWVAAEARINSSPGAQESFAALGAYFRERSDQDGVADCLIALESPPRMLLVWGSEDQIVPLSIGERAVKLLAGRAELRLIESTGHAPYLESSAEFNDMVTSFLQAASVLPA